MKLQYRYWNDGQIFRRDIYSKYRGKWLLESAWYKYEYDGRWIMS